jgi:CDP-diacylglycerol--serine O-phosphatidyltransferase
MYAYALKDMGKLGWIAAFVYCAGAALRLARFNTMLAVQDKRWFLGLPSPAAAALMAGFIWVAVDNHLTGDTCRWCAWGITLFAGISMVTTFRFYSGKDINLKKSVPFMMVVGMALIFAFISLDPPIVLFLMFVLYGLSGYYMYLRRRFFPYRRDRLPDAE